MTDSASTRSKRGGARLARMLASPVGVLITIPALVVAVGVGILLVGRDATRTVSDQMARRLLTTNVTSVQSDVSFALDQATPVLEQLRALADPARSADEALVRIHDLVIGRPGVAYASISFTDGTFRGAYLGEASAATGAKRVEVQESKLGPGGTDVRRYTVEAGALVPLRRETTDYDPRQRGFYKLAAKTGARSWTEPYTFFASHETGITCTEPVYEAGGGPLRAVLTVDFDVGALSQYVARPALDEARSVVYTRDGIILAYPAADRLALPASDKMLRHEDLRDPALEALLAGPSPTALRLSDLSTSDGGYLAAVAPIGGRRAGVAVPLDWYVATLVPTRTLLGPTHALERSSAIASAGALAIAVGVALVLAWNLLRMRRQVARSRAEARSAEARARELGSYRLVARLGAGGMGEVWRAEHRLLARTAAIKLIRPEAMHDARAADEVHERFRREAQTLASMKSRHTIAIYDYGVTELGVFYYVMELLDGLDLESLVTRYGPQPAPRVIQIVIQACASLAEAHDAGLLHRDIKPPNLFLCRAADEVDIVKLLDFGIVQTVHDAPPERAAGTPPLPVTRRAHPGAGSESRPLHLRPGEAIAKPAAADTDDAIDADEATDPGTPGTPEALASLRRGPIETTAKLTQLGAMVGTPGFMAPEQILGMPLDGRADLYALGCCAWWLLTGREIYPRGAADAKILHRHIYDAVPSLSANMTGWCPPALEAVVTACLSKDAADRPADARTLAGLLRAIAIPAERTWTPDHADAWWRAYQPPIPPTEVTGEVQVIMPGRNDQRPVAATAEGAIAQTVAAAAPAMAPTAMSEAAIAHTLAAPPATAPDDAIAKTIASPPPTRG